MGDYFISLSDIWGAEQITTIYIKSTKPDYELPNFQKIFSGNVQILNSKYP